MRGLRASVATALRMPEGGLLGGFRNTFLAIQRYPPNPLGETSGDRHTEKAKKLVLKTFLNEN
jgi:hypothetical protein